MNTDTLLTYISAHPTPQSADIPTLVPSLREAIVYHNHRYNVLDSPLISDYDYDRLFAYLVQIEQTHPQWRDDHSPTQRLAIGTDQTFAPVQHYGPLLSLDNTYNEGEIAQFHQRTQKLLHEQHYTGALDYIVEPKLDGLSVALVYENDQLLRGATRGNGTTGEEVTANIRTIASIPLVAPFSKYGIRRIEIRGEIIMSFASFRALNTQRTTAGQPPFANPRNAASGSLRQLDPTVTKARALDGYFYAITHMEGDYHCPTQEAAYQLLEQCGIKVNPIRRLCHTPTEIVEYCHQLETKREQLPYEVDGMVIKVNNMEARTLLGTTLHHPRSDIAYKFQAQEAFTTLNAITVQVGRTGILTPVAELEPVSLGGVTVKRATLHNEEDLQKKGIYIGDTVIVKRAGDVIPEVVAPVLDKRPAHATPFVMPTHCPTCHTPVSKQALTSTSEGLRQLQRKCEQGDTTAINLAVLKAATIPKLSSTVLEKLARYFPSLEPLLHGSPEEFQAAGLTLPQATILQEHIIHTSLGVTEAQHLLEQFLATPIIPHTYCPNMSCPDQIKGRLEHFVSKHALDIEGLGSTLISTFVDAGLLRTFADIFRLPQHEETLEQLLYTNTTLAKERKRLHKLFAAIESAKTTPLHRVIVGLNIPNVGRKTAKTLSQHITSLEELITMPTSTLEQLPDIGSITAQSIHDYLHTPANQEVIKELTTLGLQVQHTLPTTPSTSNWPYQGKKFIFTGELSSMSREEAGQAVEAKGGITVSSISSKTDYCVAGAKAGSKAQKAQQLEVPVLTEAAFLAMLTEEGRL